jgi:hypothetical protein
MQKSWAGDVGRDALALVRCEAGDLWTGPRMVAPRMTRVLQSRAQRDAGSLHLGDDRMTFECLRTWCLPMWHLDCVTC